ncbi:30S ribosomal protein S6 [Borreliella afzelii]|uniref:Small ribosomal subunit protein bS6 n=2 Tax=Borreliella afzelii TaxID=29518 RepID=RS6_BORAP|nr:30S ribosomal protein S6 [Borreliella afzelii]Q0SP49.1 RecName: Full=Small ribosomal subunit protein bS6; AltName: Full=30S ribosomal protein S6 [Borreliella afzelii PKo]AFU74386.1 30S ribosomal protein S6 [Borreliella afzelii HLJ01]AJY72113.1 ribosomal protein S6 [Borreliella afzelii K78]EEC20835.1 30S ribosomal protein S6 [Borreliella afzelii ACA-1]ABH01379.1 ribosomal protein S6 [Borreliella afzelii PKo]AEL69346.1 ribosomal protein S6 [Borreliella afzelii PKo]
MIKRYEACFLFKSEEIEYKGSLEEVKKSLELYGATDIISNFIGERALEYPIKKQARGRYEIIEFSMEGNNLKEFESKLKLIKSLLRYMILVKIVRKINTKKIKRRNFREFKDNIDKENLKSGSKIEVPTSSESADIQEK